MPPRDEQLDPEAMAGYVKNGIHVLEVAKKIPKGLWKNCAGIILISGNEWGFGVSWQQGAGVALAHDKATGKWSPPMAVKLNGSGVGAVFGKADKDMVVVLNPNSMEKLLKSPEGHQIKVGMDFGFAVGKIGGAGGTDVAFAEGGGAGSSLVYTYSKGGLLSAELTGSEITVQPQVNKAFYGDATPEKILGGELTIPAEAESSVSELWAKLDAMGD